MSGRMGRLRDAVDVGDLVTPGENADTVRDGLYGEAPLLGDDGALAALDALLAQAEAAEAYPPGTTNLERHLTECLQAAEADANTQHRQMKFWKEQAKNAEDERDAAVRQATENGRLAQKHWDRAEAAERVAEQAQKALRQIEMTTNKPSDWYNATARAALTGTALGGDRTTEGRAGEGTERKCMVCGEPANVSVCDRCCE